MGKEKSLIPRKFRIGQKVQTKKGTPAKVIGSAIFGTIGGMPTRTSFVEYRLQSKGSKRTFYRRERDLTLPKKKKRR